MCATCQKKRAMDAAVTRADGLASASSVIRCSTGLSGLPEHIQPRNVKDRTYRVTQEATKRLLVFVSQAPPDAMADRRARARGPRAAGHGGTPTQAPTAWAEPSQSWSPIRLLAITGISVR